MSPYDEDERQDNYAEKDEVGRCLEFRELVKPFRLFDEVRVEDYHFEFKLNN